MVRITTLLFFLASISLCLLKLAYMFPYLAFEDIQVLRLINYSIKGQYKLYHAIYCLDIINLPIDFILSMGIPVWAFVTVSECVKRKINRSSRAFSAA